MNVNLIKEQNMNKTGKNKSKLLTTDDLMQIVIDQEETIWDVTQLARELGTTPQAIRQRIRRGYIPAHKEGRKLYIIKSEYLKTLKSN